ncbi:hypothetical protein Tco_0103124 [Tanacetum coccineum]
MRSLQMDVDDEISNLVDLHMGMFGGGWKWQDLQGLLWLDHHKREVYKRSEVKTDGGEKGWHSVKKDEDEYDDNDRYPFIENFEKGQGEVKGGRVDFGVINSLFGEILGEVMGEVE